MPYYEYKCPKCEHEFEELRSMTDESPQKCPKCGAKKCARLISQSAFTLKGGGWAADGYK